MAFITSQSYVANKMMMAMMMMIQ